MHTEFSGVKFLEFLYVLDINPLLNVGLVKIVDNCGLLFSPINSVLCLAGTFSIL